jgi:hypothetical protein
MVFIAFTVVVGFTQHHGHFLFWNAPCHGHLLQLPGRVNYCSELGAKLASVKGYDTFIRVGGYLIAPLVGALLGILAVASELESRTARLDWTQSISRTQWFAAKVGLGAIFVTVILVPSAIFLSWWCGTIGDKDVFAPGTFGVAGWDLVSYGLFMFALAVLLGAVIRRTGWALAASILLFLVVAAVVPTRVRPHLVTPTVTWSEPVAATNGDGSNYFVSYPRNSWLLVNGPVPRSTVGIPTHEDESATLPKVSACVVTYPGATETEYVKAQLTCYSKFQVENVAVYIADDQFWTLQLREGIFYLLLSLIMTGGALVVVRRIEP